MHVNRMESEKKNMEEAEEETKLETTQNKDQNFEHKSLRMCAISSSDSSNSNGSNGSRPV